MKNLPVYLAFITAVLFNHPVTAQWEKTNGPFGGCITAIAIQGTSIFLGTGGGGIYRSTDNGNTWAAAGRGVPTGRIRTFAVNGETIYAGTDDNGVYRLSGNDTVWAACSLHNQIASLCAFGTVVLAGGCFGFAYSGDNGTTWDEVKDGYYVSTFIRCGNKVLAGAGTGILASIDSGRTWTMTDSNFSVNVFAANGSGIFAGLGSGNIYRSTDCAATWSRRDSGLSETYWVNSVAVKGDTVFAGMYYSGIYRSIDNGKSWKAVNRGFHRAEYITITAIAIKNDTVFAGTDYGGLFRSTDCGESWTAMNSGIVASKINGLVAAGAALYAGTDDGTVFRSSDRGGTWAALRTGIDSTVYSIYDLTVCGGRPVAAAYVTGIYHLADDGSQWILYPDFPTSSVSFFCNYGDTVYGAYNNMILRTVDGGSHWSISTFKIDTAKNKFPWISAIAANDSAVFAGTKNAGIYRSTDGGITWAKADIGLCDTVHYRPDSIICDTVINALAANGTTVFASTTRGLYCSVNHGRSWQEILPLKMRHNISALFAEGDMIFAALTYGGLLFSPNNGVDWSDVGSGMLNCRVQALAVYDGMFYCATEDAGVWRRNIAELVASTGLGPVHRVPAPAHTAITAIRATSSCILFTLSLQAAGRVMVTMHDLSGRKTATLADAFHQAGTHAIRWNTESAPRGCYALRVRAGNNAYVKIVRVMR